MNLSLLMSRIQSIIDRINTVISDNFYYLAIRTFGLSEKIDGKPAIYTGSGDYDNLTFDDTYGFTIYHRLLSESNDNDPDQGFGKNTLETENYSIKLVGFGSQRELGGVNTDINPKIANDIKALIPKRFNKAFLNTLEALSFNLSIDNVDLNKQSVYDEELEEGEFNPDNILFSIDYTVSISFLDECKTLSCDTTFDLECPTLCERISESSSQNIVDCINDAGKTEDVSDLICTPQVGIAYCGVPITGTEDEFVDNDDGFNINNGVYDIVNPINPIHIAKLDTTAPFPFETLVDDNVLNNKARYTNLIGDYLDFGKTSATYVDGDLKDKDGNSIFVGNFNAAKAAYGTYTRDHFLGTGFDHSNTISGSNYNDLFLNQVIGYSNHGFSDYFVPNIYTVKSIVNKQHANWLTFLAIFSTGASRTLSSNTNIANPLNQYLDINNTNGIEALSQKANSVGFGTIRGVILFRIHI